MGQLAFRHPQPAFDPQSFAALVAGIRNLRVIVDFDVIRSVQTSRSLNHLRCCFRHAHGTSLHNANSHNRSSRLLGRTAPVSHRVSVRSLTPIRSATVARDRSRSTLRNERATAPMRQVRVSPLRRVTRRSSAKIQPAKRLACGRHPLRTQPGARINSLHVCLFAGWPA